MVTARVQTAMPVSEAGYAVGVSTLDGWTTWDPFEQTPELRWPQAVAVYSRMASEDSRVTSLLEAISLPIRSTSWRIDPNGADANVVEFVARALHLPIVGFDAPPGKATRTKGRFSWMEHLEEVASPVLQYGHAVFEQNYRREADGLYYIRKLGPRPQWTISAFHVAADGGLDSIEQIAPASTPGSGAVVYAGQQAGPTKLPINRLVVYTRNKKPGVWQGQSILRSAYKHWLLKDKLLRIEAAVAERNGMGVPVGTAAKPNDPKEVAAMAGLARGFRGGMSAGVGLAQGQSLELLGVQGNLPDIRRAIEGHDKSIALSGLAHFLNLDGKGGSYALASVLADPFVQAVQAYCTAIARIGNAHVIEDLVDINFGTEATAPRLVFDSIGSQQDLTAAAIKLLFDAGIFDNDDGVRRAIRQRFALPSQPEPGEPEPEPEPTPPDEDEDEPVEPAAPTPPAPDPAASASRDSIKRRGNAAQGVLFNA